MNTGRIFISVLSWLQPNTLAVRLMFNTLLPMLYLYSCSIYLFHIIPSSCLSGPQHIYSTPEYSILAFGWSHSLSPDWLLVSLWIWCLINIHHSTWCSQWPYWVTACFFVCQWSTSQNPTVTVSVLLLLLYQGRGVTSTLPYYLLLPERGEEIRGSLNKFSDFFRMGTFIDIPHMKLESPSK